MNTQGLKGYRIGLLHLIAAGVLLSACQTLFAAEIRGRVSLTQTGLFNADQQSVPVSVALFPAEGQALSRRPSQRIRIEVRDRRLTPDYLVAQPGDRLEFVNRDQSHYQLFTTSLNASFDLALQPSGQDDRESIRLKQEDTLNVFCRIHASTFARIDVLDTPYARIIRPNSDFEFTGLAPGQWRLRVAAPGAETREIEVLAMTAPPPLEITLPVRGGHQGKSGDIQPQLGVEQLFPAEPGK